MMWIRRTPAAAAALAVVVAAGCARKAGNANPATPVVVATARVASVPYTVTADGVVEPLQSVAIQPQVSGPLVDVAFHEGDEVHRGQVLFRIDPRPFQVALAQARAALTRDLVQAANAAREADRYAALVTKGYVTQSQADQQRAAAASQQAVVAADSAAVEAAQLNLSYATIRAPISGRTGSLLVKEGNQVHVPNATPLVVINQLQPVLVRFTMPARALAELQRVIRSGRTPRVEATPSDLDTTAEHTPQRGTLSFMDNAVDTTTGTITLKASFPNTTESLWPGEFLTVALELYDQTDALTVPAAAVQAGQEGDYVYVVDDKRQARMTPVKVARTAGGLAVIASGLAPGMTVVTDGQSRLFPGAPVVIRAPGAPASPSSLGAAAAPGSGAGAGAPRGSRS